MIFFSKKINFHILILILILILLLLLLLLLFIRNKRHSQPFGRVVQ